VGVKRSLRCSDTWVGEEVHPSEVLSTGTPVLYRQRVILVGTYNQDCGEKARPVQEFHSFVDLELILGGGVVEEVLRTELDIP